MPEIAPVAIPILALGQCLYHVLIVSMSTLAAFKPLSVWGCLPAEVQLGLPQVHLPLITECNGSTCQPFSA
jgi:hypothetical protein